MTKPLFIVIEGGDGAGTTTQAARLRDHLVAQGRKVHLTREPSDGPVGLLIRSILRGRAVLPDGTTRNPDTMALLFAADRSDHLADEIDRHLATGHVVISDRYDLSTLVYQGAADDPARRAWLLGLSARFRRPDLTIVLSVSPREAGRRRSARGGREELFEGDDMQSRVLVDYVDPALAYPGDRVAYVIGEGTVDEVFEHVVAAFCEVDQP